MLLATLSSHQRGSAGPIPVILSAIGRLSDCVEAETQALREGARDGLDHFSHQKNLGLLELTRAMRLIGSGVPPREVVVRLQSLRETLEDNRRLLALHMSAAQEVADLVAGVLAEAASDGTYSSHILRG